MKRLTAALSILLSIVLIAAHPAEAQHQQHHRQHGQQGQQQGMMAQPDSMRGGMMGMRQGGMMGQGMMRMMHRRHQQMMQSPMHRAHMMPFMLPALADTLGLTEQQMKQINRLKSEAMAQRQEHRQQMMAQRNEFMGLFDADEPPAPQAVRQHTAAMAEMRANHQAALYETAHQVRQVLTDAQRQQLDGLSSHEVMHQMMAHMPMMDMMRMMRVMHDGMGGSGMMRGGMMQHRPMHRQGRMQRGSGKNQNR
jgi:hypothetical protein